MCKISLKASSKKAINLYIFFLKYIFKKLNIKSTVAHLPCTYKDITLLKSPHVSKKAKEHFGVKTFRTIIIAEVLPSANVLGYLLLNKPKSIFLQYTFFTKSSDISKISKTNIK